MGNMQKKNKMERKMQPCKYAWR